MKKRTVKPFWTKNLQRAAKLAAQMIAAGSAEASNELRERIARVYRNRVALGSAFRPAAEYLPPVVRIDGVAHRWQGGELVARA